MGTAAVCQQQEAAGQVIITVRRYVKETDLSKVEELERSCEAGLGSSLFVDMLGDPVCRVRHLPVYTMLVAEIVDCKKIVGVVRGGVKDVVCRSKKITAVTSREDPEKKKNYAATDGSSVVEVPVYARVGYVLGLRVCPSHRKMGIAMKLVEKMEEWCKDQQAEYVYMATEKDNVASVKLFTERLKYLRFRTPMILVHPVFLRDRPLPPDVRLTKLNVDGAAALYRATMGSTEFFPKDIHSVLANELCAGTWVATFAADDDKLLCSGLSTVSHEGGGRGGAVKLTMEAGGTWAKGASWAMVSIWRTNEVFKFEQRGASWAIRTLASASRWLEWLLPWLLIPSIPNLFNSFGFQFMFGLHSEGARGHELLNALCWHAHNTARKHGCQAFATEVAASDPVRACIPHWERLSSCEDLWCIKRIQATPPPTPAAADDNLEPDFDNTEWCKSAPQQFSKLFVDPREV